MKKKLIKLVSVMMSLCLVFSVSFAAPTAVAKTPDSLANDVGETLGSVFFAGLTRVVDVIVNGILNVVAAVTPQASGYTKYDDFMSDNYYPGTENFIDEPKENSSWSLGYARRSITPSDLLERVYYMGGFDTANIITGKYDDVMVRCVCLDDGSGRGKHLFAVVDAIGLSNSDVRGIRAAFEQKLGGDASGFASINVSATHTHSGIDSQGIWAVFGKYEEDRSNILRSMFPYLYGGGGVSGVDEAFMDLIYSQAADAMFEAYSSMTQGEMYYAEKDASKYFRYRNDPSNFIREISRFRFDPYVNHDRSLENDVAPTIIANFGCHPETVGYGDSILSADFIPYMESVMNDAGFNFLFIQGAIGGMITSDRGLSSDGLSLTRYETCVRHGEELAYFVLGMTYTENECKQYVVDKEREAADLAELGDNTSAYTPWYSGWTPVKEEKLDPILNISIQETIVKIDNPVVKFIGKLGVTSNDLLKDKLGRFYVVTEIGYLEIGKTVKVLMSPGETNPDFVNGGVSMYKETSTRRKDFEYSPLVDYFDASDHLLVFDEMNDAAGYINPDNDYAILVARYYEGKVCFNSNALLFSMCSNMGSTLIGTFLGLVDSRK